ncbi:MAG: nitronate monooxygenase, partial [Alphaproteobacteria bacterium]
MPMPAAFDGKLTLPVIAAPMFLVSGTELVIEACRAGVVGTFPALNARPIEKFDQWLGDIESALAATPDAAPYGVNLIVHRSNVRLDEDIATTVKHEVPLVISSVGHPGPVIDAVHAYGGLVFADVIHMHHARKAIQAGVDGVILVSAGAGGHAGTTNPFAMVRQLREFYDGTVILAGAISDGASVAAAQVMGADFAYLGTRFISTQESQGGAGYSQMIVDSDSNDIIYTDAISGIKGNFMRSSLERAGLDSIVV